ncbi:hypothetical protein WICPIJ_003394 [Wickerhamomyces pijperi]|uniref:Mitochondrial carrier n=1 Tax=Wickerhamomyces pijperi TaxID=599730 RepID=A0A9P8Q9R8_WICPI|nr:hypothetical protein WICPIJ_003394 [Wickerhamomyces pijperi]
MSSEILNTTTPPQPTYSNYEATVNFLKKDLVSSFIAGGLAGSISRTVVSPFERAKILFQLQGAGNANYQGVFPTIAKMYKDEGIKGMFRGNGLNCLRVFPYSAVQFYVYQKIKLNWMEPGQKELENYKRLVAGAVCGATSVLTTYPMDLVRTRLSIQTANLMRAKQAMAHSAATPVNLESPPGFITLLVKIYKTEGGIVGLYRGIWPTTLGVAPYVAINFSVYEQLKELFPDSSPFTKLALGAVSGGVGQTLMYPLDILRRRFQVINMGGNELGFHYKSVSDALLQMYRKEGFLGMYKGLNANLLKVVPSMAVSWFSYELIKDALMVL